MKAGADALIHSEDVTRIAHIAERFCQVIEELEGQPKARFLRKMDELLPLLYHSACSLPDYPWDDEDDESDDGRRVNEERNKHVDAIRMSLAQSRPVGVPIQQKVEEKLRPHGQYFFVFDPVDPDDHEAIGGSVAEDIESVYEDVGEALDLYRSGDEAAMRQAIWDWTFNRKIHWGFHLLNAMTAISSLLHRHYEEDDEVFDV